jgi:4-hydroxythreonine-4-phosphate dehydrogenase
MGDPAGIGPEIIAMALRNPATDRSYRMLVVGDDTAMTRAFGLLGVADPFVRLRAIQPGSLEGPGPYLFPASSLSVDDIAYGRPAAAAASATIEFIRQAVRVALEGLVEAVCTAPINKRALAQVGFAFPGHTEFLQHLTGAERTVMMLAGPSLRVSLVTVHCALAGGSGLLSSERITEVILLTHRALVQDFGITQPRLAVAGLNPHAGEGGLFGEEEQRLIEPAVSRCRRDAVDVMGPLPPDTVFYHASRGTYDAVVSMYHDQGLIPLKLLHFRDAVNTTLGLPIIRTSVDHGTAYDLAGTGKASPASLLEALKLAATMAQRRRDRKAHRADAGA